MSSSPRGCVGAHEGGGSLKGFVRNGRPDNTLVDERLSAFSPVLDRTTQQRGAEAGGLIYTGWCARCSDLSSGEVHVNTRRRQLPLFDPEGCGDGASPSSGSSTGDFIIVISYWSAAGVRASKAMD